MMTEKRFQWNERIEGRIVEEFIVDNLTKKELDEEDMCELLNELNDENKKLHKVIEENENVIQSIYEELTKLRHIKENLRKIKNQWNWIIGSIDYD